MAIPVVMQLFTELMIIAKTNKAYYLEIMNNKVENKNNALPINNIFFLLYLSAKIPDGISKITFIKYEIVTKNIYPLEEIPFSR